MLRNVDEKKILEALDRETRLVLAHAACIILALSPGLSAEGAVSDACEVFSAVFKGGEKKEE